ncbi:MAG: hypothetical protein OEM38_12345 [Gammaproteobacteria bacterium]|nr:hypothetical protein [Gammaproteobacteria bacterium]
MMRKLTAALFLLMFIAPVHAKSAHETCTNEVRELGIEDGEEIKFYVDECIARITNPEESGQEPIDVESGEEFRDEASDSEMDQSELEPPVAREL